MDPKTKALFDFYRKENKSDFFNAYLYMKYLYQFELLFMMNDPEIPPRSSLKKEGGGISGKYEAWRQNDHCLGRPRRENIRLSGVLVRPIGAKKTPFIPGGIL